MMKPIVRDPSFSSSGVGLRTGDVWSFGGSVDIIDPS
jgi:hypothetical protein